MKHSAWKSFIFTFWQCCTNSSCALFFLAAPVFYLCYYCWPYLNQLPEHLSTVIVDMDNTSYSREICRAIAAGPYFRVTAVTDSRPDAIEMIKKGKAVSLVDIPESFTRNLLTDLPTGIALYTNGAFLVMAKTSAGGLAAIVDEISVKAVTRRLAQLGEPWNALAQPKAPEAVRVELFNKVSGYLNFAVPIVFVIIFQSLMICGMGMLINQWFHTEPMPEALTLGLSKFAHTLALLLPVAIICFIWCLAVEGAGFAWQGINSFQKVAATITLSFFYSLTIAALGLLLSFLFGRKRYILQTVVTSSIPCVFISGNLFPWQNIPWPMQLFASFIPSTAGVDGMLAASQAGANVIEIMPYLSHLFILFLLYFGLSLLVGRARNREKVA